MTPSARPDVVVIGAGIAGVTAARALQRDGRRVEVLEKSRGVGGRTATRTVHGARVDHGAQFFTAREPAFTQEVAAGIAAGVIVPWTDGLPTWSAQDGWRPPEPGAHPRYACPDGMTALAQHMARDLDVTRGARVATIAPVGGDWAVGLDDGSVRHAARVVVTAPVPQALALLAAVELAGALQTSLEALSYAPCWTIIAGYPGVPVPVWPALRWPDHPDLALVANDASRRRHALHAVLVLHATADYTRRRFDAPPGDVADELLRAATAAVPWADRPGWVDHQRWRYARPETRHEDVAVQVAPGIVLAGDGFGGGSVEGAYRSGLAAAVMLGG